MAIRSTLQAKVELTKHQSIYEKLSLILLAPDLHLSASTASVFPPS